MYQSPVERKHEFPTLGDLVSSGFKVFDDSWETYVPEYKKVLEQKIIRHYFFYEIGVDTPDKFRFYINQELAEIMPYYNQLYASTLIKFDPMVNHALTQNKRSVENLAKLANTQNSTVAQTVKNFMEKASQSGNGSETGNASVKSALDKWGDVVYTKGGEEDISSHEDVNSTGHSVSDTDKDIDITTKTDEVVTTHELEKQGGEDVTHGTTDETSDSLTTPNLTETTEGKKDRDVKGKETSKGSSTDDVTTDSESNEKTHLHETTNEDKKQDFSDTPQRNLGQDQITRDYLTNVTWTDTDTEHTADGTKDATYHETKAGKGTTEGTKDTEETVGDVYNETKVQSGTSDVHGTKHGESDGTTTYGKTITSDGTKTTDGTKIESGHTDETTTTDSTDEKVTDGTSNKEWSEEGHEVSHDTSKGTEDRTNKVLTESTNVTESNRQDNTAESRAGAEQTDTKQVTDTGVTEIQSGFMNISGSALLKAFRETFINVDEQIINKLADNFMQVFQERRCI